MRASAAHHRPSGQRRAPLPADPARPPSPQPWQLQNKAAARLVFLAHCRAWPVESRIRVTITPPLTGTGINA
jgi:hypothetical protein